MGVGVERRIFVNTQLPDSCVDKFGAQLFSYPKNKIRTSKYTILNFIPKNLWEQCRRIANLFFIFLIFFQFIPVFQEMDPIWAIIPLASVMFVTACKDGYEDMRRHQMDTNLNNSIAYIPDDWENLNYPSTKLPWKEYILSTLYWYFTNQYKPKIRKLKRYKEVKPSALSIAPIIGMDSKVMGEDSLKDAKGRSKSSISLAEAKAKLHHGWKKVLWKYVRVGDIVCIANNEMLPADIVILSTCEKDNICYAETKSLDGETSLKVRKGPKETAYLTNLDEIKSFRGYIDAEAPMAELQHFSGVLVLPGESTPGSTPTSPSGPNSFKKNHISSTEKANKTKSNSKSSYNTTINSDEVVYSEGEHAIPLNVNNVLLRGSIVRNTEWVIGVVIYTGCDTKVMLGSGNTPSKRSKIEKTMNPQVIFNFFVLFFMSILIACIHYYYISDWLKLPKPWVNYENGAIKSMIYALGNAVILLQTIIPISLYVTVEIVKMLQTFLIGWDVDMYYENTNEACIVKTWTISDDLGQIEYIFSDKTGTLTQNKMEFRRCSINGVVYGIRGTDVSLKGRNRELIRQKEDQIEVKMRKQMEIIYKNPYLQSNITLPFIDENIMNDILYTGDKAHDKQAANIRKFFNHIAICHTVLSPKSTDPDNFIYGAESPDEQSLVTTAKDLGFIFLARSQTHITLNILGEETVYRILNILEFNSTRKRMSVIIEDEKKNEIMLLCKGADNIIYERLKEKNELSETTYTQLENFANEGLRTLCLAMKIIPREEYEAWNNKYMEAARTIEKREEKMEAVAELIEKDLVLLGATAIEDRLQDGVPDCIDTLLKAGIKIWVLTGDKFETAVNIGFACNLLKKSMLLLTIRNPVSNKGKSEMGKVSTIEEQLNEAKNQASVKGKYGMIIEGLALRHVFENEKNKKLFLEICVQCEAVICCRVAPKQKAEVVKLVKDNLKALCLSIGDGANDVSMIQEANVGIGIAGEEGMQAAMSADYVISQFRFLSRLLLVHGRWSYERIANCVMNFFFKNILWVFIMFWFQFFDGFSATMVFDYTLWMYYNILFTALPVGVIGVLDQDINAKYAMKIPQVYPSTKKKQVLFTTRRFIGFVLNAMYQSILCFFIPLYMFQYGGLPHGYENSRQIIGHAMACYGIIVANLTALFTMHSWTIVGTLLIAIEALSYFIYIPTAKFFDVEAPDLWALLQQPLFWLGLVIVIVLSGLPFMIVKYAKNIFCPSDLTLVKEMQHINDSYIDLESQSQNGTPTPTLTSPKSPGSCTNESSCMESVISDRDTIPLKYTLSAPTFSNRYIYYRKLSFYDTNTKTEKFNTGYAFSYNDEDGQEEEISSSNETESDAHTQVSSITQKNTYLNSDTSRSILSGHSHISQNRIRNPNDSSYNNNNNNMGHRFRHSMFVPNHEPFK